MNPLKAFFRGRYQNAETFRSRFQTKEFFLSFFLRNFLKKAVTGAQQFQPYPPDPWHGTQPTPGYPMTGNSYGVRRERPQLGRLGGAEEDSRINGYLWLLGRGDVLVTIRASYGWKKKFSAIAATGRMLNTLVPCDSEDGELL